MQSPHNVVALIALAYILLVNQALGTEETLKLEKH